MSIEKLTEFLKLLKKYETDHKLDFSLALNDATIEQLENNAVPYFEVDNKKMGKTEFFDIIGKVEDRVFEQKSENEYLLKGKINIGYTSTDKWNPEAIYEDYNLAFKCWNYFF